MLSRLYAAVMNVRNRLYERGAFKSESLSAYTVSIGNITTGGTGKTPLVAFTARILAENGYRVGVLTRGYGRANPRKRILVSDGETILRDAREAGDEPVELARKLLGRAVIVADANRRSAGAWARTLFGITAFVLDDAFQHQQVKRDLNVVCVDATNPFGNGKTLPTGILREPLENLNRADAIVITRSNLVENIAELKARIKKYNHGCPIFVSKNKFSKLKSVADGNVSEIIDDARAKTYLAFCALGNPENFFAQLRDEKFNLAATEKFPDHHFYTGRDIAKLIERARQTGAEWLLTTVKDAVKLKNLTIDLPCWAIENELVFDDEADFRRLLLQEKNKSD